MIVQPNARDLVLNHIAGTGRNRAKRLHDALWDLDTRGRVGYTGSGSGGPMRPHVELVAAGAIVSTDRAGGHRGGESRDGKRHHPTTDRKPRTTCPRDPGTVPCRPQT